MLTNERKQQMAELHEKLLEVYLAEADPDEWVTEESARKAAQEHIDNGGSKVEATKIAAGWKGERYWEKKNANQTMTLLINIHRLIDAAGGQGAAGDDEGDLGKEIKKAERTVKKRLARSRPTLIQGGRK